MSLQSKFINYLFQVYIDNRKDGVKYLAIGSFQSLPNNSYFMTLILLYYS